MISIDLNSAVSALESTRNKSGYRAYSQLLEHMATSIGARIAASWRYNVREGYYSCYCRYGYKPNPNDIRENIHKSDDSLLDEIFRKLTNDKLYEIIDSSSSDLIARHWAPQAIIRNSIRTMLAIPFSNGAIKDKKHFYSGPTGVVIFYFQDEIQIQEAVALFISFAFSQIYTDYFLQKKDSVTSNVIEYFSKNIIEDPDRQLNQICSDILCNAFNVEACTIYEWSSHQNAYKIVSTTGLVDEYKSILHYDRRGAGLISAIAGIKKTISIKNIRDTESVNSLIRQKLSEELIMKHMERTASPIRTVLFVPVFNPIQAKDSNVTAVLKFVNKKLYHENVVDFFDIEDMLVAEEVATIIALHEEQSRSIKQQVAFALQFGHEAQAPAVGIKGTADRIMLKFEKGEIDQIPSMAQDIFDFAEMLIAFSESLSFGFGDRSLPKGQRYSFRQFNIRRSIDAAKKVVIPICREEGLQYDDITITGSYPLVFADNRAFMQVFYNLLTNAIKYRSRKNGDIFKIIISSRFIESIFLPDSEDKNLSFAAKYWRQKKLINKGIHIIDISDFGVGIHPEEFNKVFLQGFRSPGIGATDIRGSGIGLSIVRNILFDFDSVIWVASAQDPTTFRIAIPDGLESGLYSRRETVRRL